MARPAVYDEDTRAALLEAAARRLAEGGAEAVTMRALAREVGATTSAIYALFGSKEGLLAAVYREAFAGLALELARVPVGDDPLRELFELGLAYRRSARARPALYLVMFGRDPVAAPPSEEDEALAAGTLGRLSSAVARAQAAGALPGDDPLPLTLQLWGVVHGLASLELLGALGDDTAADVTWEQALRAIVRGHQHPGA
ncbi:TetR/AcrR family transcriptional regulator [Egicoccus sp. AB-alg2]|uniref:TetR/AcrR family transcriptional regulator n=1 Tax=Egicoccus sp. AB-alg2 TaxID=3242693 RepID=UPI00359DC9AA